MPFEELFGHPLSKSSAFETDMMKTSTTNYVIGSVPIKLAKFAGAKIPAFPLVFGGIVWPKSVPHYFTLPYRQR